MDLLFHSPSFVTLPPSALPPAVPARPHAEEEEGNTIQKGEEEEEGKNLKGGGEEEGEENRKEEEDLEVMEGQEQRGDDRREDLEMEEWLKGQERIFGAPSVDRQKVVAPTPSDPLPHAKEEKDGRGGKGDEGWLIVSYRGTSLITKRTPHTTLP